MPLSIKKKKLLKIFENYAIALKLYSIALLFGTLFRARMKKVTGSRKELWRFKIMRMESVPVF